VDLEKPVVWVPYLNGNAYGTYILENDPEGNLLPWKSAIPVLDADLCRLCPALSDAVM
jgi:hypothetical protein